MGKRDIGLITRKSKNRKNWQFLTFPFSVSVIWTFSCASYSLYLMIEF